MEPAVDAEQIGVSVKNGIVTLTGHVDRYPAKWNAERAARRVVGVKALMVEIDDKLNGSIKCNDANLAQSCENVLLWTTYLSKDSVKVMVEGGWVTLSGQVQWGFQRATATAAVRHISVTGVSNQITIKPGVSASAVKSEIEEALKRRLTNEINGIKIPVNGTEVTLTGKVPTWS